MNMTLKKIHTFLIGVLTVLLCSLGILVLKILASMNGLVLLGVPICIYLLFKLGQETEPYFDRLLD